MNLLHSLYFRYVYLRENRLADTLARWVRTPSVRSAQRWNHEYANGQWARLKDLSEQAHNAVLLEYIAYLRPGASILDIGCGDGVLLTYLARLRYQRYLGIDISSTAIEKCQRFRDDRTSFQIADAETYDPDFRPDVVVLNESIYYFHRPIEALERYNQHLAPNGILVLSLVDNPKTRTIIRCLKTVFSLIDQTTVSNSKAAWHCLVLARLNT